MTDHADHIRDSRKMVHPDHATRARALLDDWRTIDPTGFRLNALRDLITAALTRAAEEAVTAFQVAIRDYVTMRADMAEQGIATEVLAGNVMKEARERAALAELQGLQDAILNYWKRPAKSQAAQPAWSKDTPTVAGQYWHRGVKSDDPVIVRVVAAGKRLLVLYPGDPLHYTLPNIDERGDIGEWAGPIQLPREA